jgi:hypothetical protein
MGFIADEPLEKPETDRERDERALLDSLPGHKIYPIYVTDDLTEAELHAQQTAEEAYKPVDLFAAMQPEPPEPTALGGIFVPFTTTFKPGDMVTIEDTVRPPMGIGRALIHPPADSKIGEFRGIPIRLAFSFETAMPAGDRVRDIPIRPGDDPK